MTAPQVASLNLAFAADDLVQSATLNGKALKFEANPTPPTSFQTLAGKADADSSFFKLGTNTLVVKVLNLNATPYGFYAEGTAITGTNAVSSCPRAQRESHLCATLQPHTRYKMAVRSYRRMQ